MTEALKDSAIFVSSGDLLADRRYEMARAYHADGDRLAAIDLLEQALEIAPAFAAGWFDLGDWREQVGQREGAILAFERALAADPSDRYGAGLRLRLLNIGGHAMSADYVRSVFDQYASRFDQALAALSYTAPELLFREIVALCAERGRACQFGTMLDLGCGTGLSGVPLRGAVEWMEGVDLSPGMVEQARRKNIYDKLETGDLTEVLDRHVLSDARFNLIVAADVFVYCADLNLIASLTSQILANDGLFAFTVETHPGGGVVLGATLRYAHGEAHVRDALRAAGLSVLRLREVSTRLEADVPVPGLLVIAGRA